MELRDLLAHGVVRAVQDGAAEDDGAGGFEVGGRDGGYGEGYFGAVADDERGQGVVVVHDVELGDAGDEVVVERQEDVALAQGLAVGAGRGRAVDLADHEELVAGGVGGGDAGDPGFGDADDARLGHLHGVGFDVEDAQLGGDVVADLGDDGEEGRGGETEVVFDVFLGGVGTLAEVVEPEGFDGAVFGDEHTAAALATQACVDGDGV